MLALLCMQYKIVVQQRLWRRVLMRRRRRLRRSNSSRAASCFSVLLENCEQQYVNQWILCFEFKKIIQCRNGKPDFHGKIQLFSIHCIKRSQFHAISDFVYKTMKSSNALLSYNLKNIVYQCISRGDTYKICN